MRCLAFLRRLGGGRLLALIADKGATSQAELEGRSLPVFVGHGSVSLSVDFKALGVFAEANGGGAVLLGRVTEPLALCAYWFGDSPPASVRSSIELWFDRNHPMDALRILDAVRSGEPSVEQVFVCLRHGRCDAETLMVLAPLLFERLGELGSDQRRVLVGLLHETWEGYFPIGDAFDLAFTLAGLLYQLGEYQSALRYLNHSRALYGDETESLFNQALCLYQLGQQTACAELLAAIQAHDPEYAPARQLAEALSASDIAPLGWAGTA